MATKPARVRRIIAQIVVATQVWVPIAPAFAQSVPAITDEPLYTYSGVQANLMLTVDNSGSMDWQFAPMYTSSNKSKKCFTSTLYNQLYFDPTQTYTPPVKSDGTRYSDSNFTSAWLDGYRTSEGTRNLSTQFPATNNYGDTSLGSANRSAYYHVYSGSGTPAEGTCYSDGNYTLVDVNAASSAVKQNFANWFSYYRTRMYALKTSVGEAFRVVDESFRVGIHTINNPSSTGTSGGFLALATFNQTQRDAFYTVLYRQQPSGNTPLREAQQRIGEYYRTAANPAGSGSVADPIQFTCQQNYHLLSTDGQWNASGASGTVGSTNYDRTLPNNADLLNALGAEFGTSFSAGASWPRPYRENPSQTSTNTLSDLAAYYWMTDLRPSMTNNVFTSTANPANWQHMVTYGLAFSEQGTIAYPSGLSAIVAGTANWPKPSSDQASTIDDLWHAALIGHGQFFSVSSPKEMMVALASAISDIQARQGSNSGSVLTGSDFAVGTPIAFRAQYKSGEWTGDLQARSVDPVTGVISAGAVWKAQDKLETQVTPSGSGGGWSTNRMIVTRSNATTSGTAVRFREPGYSGSGGAISTTQHATLDADPARATQILHYLRGDRTNEDTPFEIKSFRRRPFVLGDIVNSEPRYVGAPFEPYSDAYHLGYASFRSAQASRTPMVYVGSNDGLLHAIKGTVGDADSGAEKWAYMPSFMLRSGVEGVGALAWRQSDPVPNKFAHRFRVDQTPTVRDIDISRVRGAAATGQWRTLLVGGLNKGGKGYYALDVTSPLAASEDDLRSKVMWEFDGSQTGDTTRLGYSFGPPMVMFTNHGWLVAVTSGYQNATGTGHIWLLDPRDGTVVKRLDVPDNATATLANPIGLAPTEVFFQSDREALVHQLYATDLRGNVWRFDLSGADPASWPTDGTKIASVSAPITSSPAIAINPRDRSERWVYFGTGQLLAVGDMATMTTRTFYAIKDGSASTPGTFASPLTAADLVEVLPTSFAPQGPGVKGWFMQMSSGGQVVIAPHVARGVVMWASTTPTTDACSPGASALFYAREMGAATNRLVSGAPYVPINAPVTKLQVAQSTATAGSTSSQRKQILIASTSGADILVDVNLQVVLTGGRSNFRFVTAR